MLTTLMELDSPESLDAHVQKHADARVCLRLNVPTEDVYEALVALGDALFCIQELVLQDANLEDPGSQPHAAAFFSSRWLGGVRSMTFQGGAMVGVAEMRYLVDLLAQNDAIDQCASLTLDRCSINFDAWTSLVLGKWWSRLTDVSILQSDLDDRMIDPVCLWSPFVALERFTLATDTLTDWGVETRVALARWPSTLRSFEVQGALLTNLAWEHLAACEALPDTTRESFRARADAHDGSWEARFGELRAQLQEGFEEAHQRKMLLERLRQFHDEDRVRYRDVVLPYMKNLDLGSEPFWIEFRGRLLSLNRTARLLPFVSLGLHICEYDETFHLDWARLTAAPALRHVGAVFLGGGHEFYVEELRELLDGEYGSGVTTWGFDDPQDQAEVEAELHARGLEVLEPLVFMAQAFGKGS